MISRWQELNLRNYLRIRRGVHLAGARQCGKSTLAEFVAGTSMRHITLDDDLYLRAAREDPRGFVERLDDRTLVIDEIQKVPELLNAIKIQLDHDNSTGQYLITGSSNLHFVKAVRDSLAGRLGRIRLRTLASGEIMGGQGDFLKKAFAREFKGDYPEMGKREVIHCAFCGGYPEPREFASADRKQWFAEYLDDLLTKDIQEITEVRKIDSLKKVAHWLLSYSSKFFEFKDMCATVQLSKETAANYLAALKALYLLDELSPWADRDYKRLGKRSKYFVSDPGLVANILGWNEDVVYYDSDASGKLVETWVYHELASLAEVESGYELSHYRDCDKREIDFMVKREDGALLGIEVKAGSVCGDDFKHLKWFGQNLVQAHSFTGIVLYGGSGTLRFGEGYYAVPFSALAS